MVSVQFGTQWPGLVEFLDFGLRDEILRGAGQSMHCAGDSHGQSLCSRWELSFILLVCHKTIEQIRSKYFSCPSVHSNPTGAGDRRSMAFARA